MREIHSGRDLVLPLALISAAIFAITVFIRRMNQAKTFSLTILRKYSDSVASSSQGAREHGQTNEAAFLALDSNTRRAFLPALKKTIARLEAEAAFEQQNPTEARARNLAKRQQAKTLLRRCMRPSNH